MATCNKCDGEIEFYHNGFNAVPIHVSGSCSAAGSSYGYGGGGWVVRETSAGQNFVFGWVEYPSYVNPNASCPRCGKSVYFYQSPSGGRVYFNELGPPWPKHGPSPWECLDRGDIITSKLRVEKSKPQTDQVAPNLAMPEWRKAGWSPLLLAKAEPTGSGIIIEASELLEDLKCIELKLVQVDIQDTFQEARGALVFLYSMTMNSSRLISVLTENVVFIRRVNETTLELSTVSITKDDELINFTFRMKAH